MFQNLKQQMKKYTIILLCLILCFSAAPTKIFAADVATDAIPEWPKGPEPIYSDTAVLIEASTGAVLYDKGMNEVLYPASITKIMTAIVALENSNLTDTVTFTDTACALAVPGNARIDAKPGEIMTMEQCLYALMLASANEVGCQIAIQIAGSEAAFAEMMNAKAAELGCTNTHFTNASGLHDANHYTTAYDMALIMQYAIQNQEFLTITGSSSYTIPATNLSAERTLSTHNAMMVPGDFYYEGTFSGKSGNTSEAGSTLVTTVTRNNMTLICVVLKAADGGQSVADTTALMDYGYNNFTLTDVSVQNQERTGNVILPNGIDFSSLIEDTDEAGSIFHYSYQGHFMGSAVSNIEEKTAETNDISSVSTVSPSPVISESSENENFFTPAHIIMLVLVVMILAGIFCIFLGLKKSKKKKRKRR